MQNPQLAKLEQRAYRTLVDDGLLDLGLGLLFLSFFANDYLPFDGTPGLAFLFIIVGWQYARRRFIEPRVGSVHLSVQRKSRVRAGRRWMMALIAVPLFIVVAWVMVASRGEQQPLNGYGGLLIAASFGLAALVGGHLLELQRFWLYGLSLVGATCWTTFVSEPFDGLQWVIAGSIALAGGIIVLVKFLGRYPPPRDDNPSGFGKSEAASTDTARSEEVFGG